MVEQPLAEFISLLVLIGISRFATAGTFSTHRATLHHEQPATAQRRGLAGKVQTHDELHLGDSVRRPTEHWECRNGNVVVEKTSVETVVNNAGH